ncbi:NAD(P)-binding protein [Peniophora sp. CONT]|nr:NAD(P)-binding protein [Peniophora sp. CONT]
MPSTVALIGAGDVAKFFTEELLAAGHKILVLSRAPRPWFTDRKDITFLTSDYTSSSFLHIFDAHSVETVFCFIHDNTSFYVDAHEAILDACRKSKVTKRFVPSEYDGDIEEDGHWDKPRFHLNTHVPFRRTLQNQSEVEYTLLCHGWFMDYILTAEKSYMKDIYPVWPVDLNNGESKVEIAGTGEEVVGLTAARDVARVGVKLVEMPKGAWNEKTYVCGEYTTWNNLLTQLSSFYNRKFNITYKPASLIQSAVTDPSVADADKAFVYMQEWNVSGASAPPRDKLFDCVRQGVKLRSVAELLEDGRKDGIV